LTCSIGGWEDILLRNNGDIVIVVIVRNGIGSSRIAWKEFFARFPSQSATTETTTGSNDSKDNPSNINIPAIIILQTNILGNFFLK
jgi:hypothetical protein